MLEAHAFRNVCIVQEQEKNFPRSRRQSDFISHFTTDMRYLPGKGNFVADGLSRICEIPFSKLADSELWAELQTKMRRLRIILNGKVECIRKLAKLQILMLRHCTVKLGEVNRIYVLQVLKKKTFESIHVLSLTGLLASICSKYIWPKKKDVAAWCRACITLSKDKCSLPC